MRRIVDFEATNPDAVRIAQDVSDWGDEAEATYNELYRSKPTQGDIYDLLQEARKQIRRRFL